MATTATGNPSKSLNVMTKGEQPIYFDKLMFGWEESILGRVLSPSE